MKTDTQFVSDTLTPIYQTRTMVIPIFALWVPHIFQWFVKYDLKRHWAILSCCYPWTGVTILRKNPTDALIYINTTLFTPLHSYRGADKSLARQGRKQVAATKLFNFCKPLKKEKIRKFVRPTKSPRQQWPPRRTKNGDFSMVLFQSGPAKDLSASLYTYNFEGRCCVGTIFQLLMFP